MAIDSERARKKIESVTDLPTLPTVANRIVATANNPKASATEIGAIISRDQALTGKVLKLVNSAYYGFPQQIKTVNHAIVILGFNKVKMVALTASIFDLTRGRLGHRLHIPTLWMHALGTAIAAQAVASEVGGGISKEDAFVAGLLHDFGKLILDQFLTKEYEPVLEKTRERNTLLLAMEREILGFDHEQAGHWVMQKWMLPPPLVAAVRHHHNPCLAQNERGLAFAVHLGDILARVLEIGSGGDNSLPLLDISLATQLGVDGTFYEKVIRNVFAQLKRAQEFFDLIEQV
ncbi:MAG: HDOD domain-containing protein [Planctomycetota bacterium]